jgi:glutamate synthase (NADPH/NADH) small chain
VPGSEFVIEADLVVIALGTNPNPLVPHSTRGLDVDSQGGWPNGRDRHP